MNNKETLSKKLSLLKTMLNCAFKLSSNWQFFHQQSERLKMVFVRLHYPKTLIENTIRHFIEMRVTENVCSKQQVSEEQDAHICPHLNRVTSCSPLLPTSPDQ